mgnify:CR=1 FL=1
MFYQTLAQTAVALFVLFAGAARARIVTAHFTFAGLRRQILGCGFIIALMAELLHLRQALGPLGSLLLGEHLLVQARAEHGHGRDLVLQLRLLILRLNDQARRQMRDAHCRVGRVDTLTTWAARTIVAPNAWAIA